MVSQSHPGCAEKAPQLQASEPSAAECLTVLDDTFELIRDWSGSAFVAGEKVENPAAMISALYGDLCSLGNQVMYARDGLAKALGAAPASPAPEAEPSAEFTFSPEQKKRAFSLIWPELEIEDVTAMRELHRAAKAAEQAADRYATNPDEFKENDSSITLSLPTAKRLLAALGQAIASPTDPISRSGRDQ